MEDPQLNAVESGDKTKLDKVMKLLKLIGQTLIWIADGKRGLEGMIRLLQLVNDRPDFESELDASRPVPSTPPLAPKVQDPFGVKDWKAEMKKFYREVFGLKVDFSLVAIKDDSGGFDWAMFVPKGMTLNQAWFKCCERFPAASSNYRNDHDSAVPTNERVAAESYCKRFRPRVEADEENKKLSANALAERGGENVTLMERFLQELWYHWKTGKHLDMQCITLCAGSRDHYGGVPRTLWSFGKFRVWHYYPDYCFHSLRSRSAV